jgi:hypothetical protein
VEDEITQRHIDVRRTKSDKAAFYGGMAVCPIALIITDYKRYKVMIKVSAPSDNGGSHIVDGVVGALGHGLCGAAHNALHRRLLLLLLLVATVVRCLGSG